MDNPRSGTDFLVFNFPGTTVMNRNGTVIEIDFTRNAAPVLNTARAAQSKGKSMTQGGKLFTLSATRCFTMTFHVSWNITTLSSHATGSQTLINARYCNKNLVGTYVTPTGAAALPVLACSLSAALPVLNMLVVGCFAGTYMLVVGCFAGTYMLKYER